MYLLEIALSRSDNVTVFVMGCIFGYVGAYLIGSFMMSWITSLRTN